MADKQMEKNRSNTLFMLIGMSTAILLVSPVIILLALGYFLDHILHTSPLYMIIGIIVGFISGVINVFRMIQLMQRRKNPKP